MGIAVEQGRKPSTMGKNLEWERMKKNGPRFLSGHGGNKEGVQGAPEAPWAMGWDKGDRMIRKQIEMDAFDGRGFARRRRRREPLI